MVTYRLEIAIFDDKSPTPHVPVFKEVASLDVATLTSISDRAAFNGLARVLHDALVPDGSTVEERRAINDEPVS